MLIIHITKTGIAQLLMRWCPHPHWTYQPGDPGIRRLNHMITCILEGMQNILISMSVMIKSEKSPKGQMKIQPYSWHASQRQIRSIST